MTTTRDRAKSPPSELDAHQGAEWNAGLLRFCRLRAQYGYDISLPGAEKSAARVLNKGWLAKAGRRAALTPEGLSVLARYRAQKAADDQTKAAP